MTIKALMTGTKWTRLRARRSYTALRALRRHGGHKLVSQCFDGILNMEEEEEEEEDI